MTEDKRTITVTVHDGRPWSGMDIIAIMRGEGVVPCTVDFNGLLYDLHWHQYTVGITDDVTQYILLSDIEEAVNRSES